MATHQPSSDVPSRSVADVFSPREGRDSASICTEQGSRSCLFPKVEDPSTAISSRTASVRPQDIPAVLKRITGMNILRDRSAADSGMGPEGRDPDYSIVAYDVDALRASFSAIREAFPPHWKHCFAVKACPLAFVIDEALDAGLGIEAASFIELYLGLARGCPADIAVFDSPAKTSEELAMALASGALVNANSLDELDRIAAIVEKQGSEGGPKARAAPRVGIRLNPMVGAGHIAAFSVSVPTSKFGVPATSENIRSVVDAFRRWPWLIGLHTHVGSQGLSLEQLATGIATLCKVADTVDGELGNGRVALLDVGGGLPANYETDEVTPTFAEYAAILRQKAPILFENPERTVITEFGRAVVAKTAIAVSTIEYVRHNAVEHSASEEIPKLPKESEATGSGDHPHNFQTLITHLGADLFMRTAYCPEKFSHRIALYERSGQMLSTTPIKTDVAGPLCFQGDYMARDLFLPRATERDLAVALDTGANTLSVFSRHCSRPAPAVYGFARDSEDEIVVRLVKERETIEDVARFWGVSDPSANDLYMDIVKRVMQANACEVETDKDDAGAAKPIDGMPDQA